MEEKKNSPSEEMPKEKTEEEVLIERLESDNKHLKKELEIIRRELELCHEQTMKL